jgi:hypothetical protein
MKALASSLLSLVFAVSALAETSVTSDVGVHPKKPYHEPVLRAAKGGRLPVALPGVESSGSEDARVPEGAPSEQNDTLIPPGTEAAGSARDLLETNETAAFSNFSSSFSRFGLPISAVPASRTDYPTTGVFLLHAPPGLAYSSDAPPEGWCAAWSLAECEDQVNEISGSDAEEWTWYILSNFYEVSTFRGVEYGILYDADAYVRASGEVCAPSQALTIEYPETGAWPQAGSGIAIALMEEPYWSGTTVATGMIHGWHYTSMPPATITLGPNPATGFCGWLATDANAFTPRCIGILGVDTEGQACCAGPPPVGACCFLGQRCESLTQEDCIVQGGTYVGDDLECAPNPCPPDREGACCFPNGACQVTTELNCEQLEGEYFADDVGCSPNPCPQPPRGACCFPDGCQYITEESCSQQGGDYLGDGIRCSPNPCPHGACCLPGGFCHVLSPEACTDQGGDYLGDDTSCTPHPCPLPLPGDTFEDAIVIAALPFHDYGSLANYEDDYDFGYGDSPDVVYAYRPAQDCCVTLDGCSSGYDQMLFLLDESLNIVAWNDDACGLASRIAIAELEANRLYYCVVDGWEGSSGPFDLNVFERDCPQPVECPPRSILEGEGCHDPYEDHYNGGCNYSPSVFQAIHGGPLTIHICGSTFQHTDYEGLLCRDTDWYELVDLPWLGPTRISVQVYSETRGDMYFLLVDEPCVPYIMHAVTFESREPAVLEAELNPAQGRWIVFVSVPFEEPPSYPCRDWPLRGEAGQLVQGARQVDGDGWPYVLTIDGYHGSAAPESAPTWGRVKSMFR